MLQRKTALTELPPGLAWIKHCGFLDLSPEGFLQVQEEQVLSALPRLARSGVGRHFLQGRIPRTVRELRRHMPLTAYGDYIPYLCPEAAAALPEPPVFWAQTTRRGGDFTLIPYTQAAFTGLMDSAIALIFLAGASAKGQVQLKAGDRILYNLAPPPYLSGFLAEGLPRRLDLRPVLPLEASGNLDFDDTIALGFTKALDCGVDVMVAMTSVLVRAQEQFSRQARRGGGARRWLRPQTAWRLLRAWLVSRLQGRPILPKDLWPMKALLCWGMDTPLYRQQLKEHWGCEPYEFAAATEAGILAAQSWTRRGLTFFPTANFLEFLPEGEALKLKEHPNPHSQTLLLNQLEAGQRYELIITSCTGMPFLRYRLGQLVEVESLGDEAAGITLPQVRFVGRCDDIIDLAGFTRLDELTLQRAVQASKVPVEDWVARREVQMGAPALCFYLELRDGHPPDLAERLDRALKEQDRFYRDLDLMLGLQPLRVTTLAPGTFQRYYEKRRAAGAALAQRRAPRLNPTEEEIQALLNLSRAAAP